MTSLHWDRMSPENFPEFDSLLDSAFALTSPANYLSDFPVWNPAIALADQRFQVGGWDGKRLITTASIRFAEYGFEEEGKEVVGLIGAVATRPEFHGKGFASSALEQVLTEGRKRGVRTFALWGNESPLYRKKGFQLGGLQLRTPLERLRVDGEIPEGYEVRTGWDVAIAELLLRRKKGIFYRDSDVLWLSRHRGVEWRTLWFEGKCLAFAGWNRGIDLANILHEIEGTPAGMRTLLLFLKRRYPSLELLHHPRHGEFGVRTLAATECLAQFLFEDPQSRIAKNVNSIWLSGMDSC